MKEGKVNQAIEKFIKKYKKNPNVVGIVLAGSYVYYRKELNKHSDLDVQIIVKSSERRVRGNTWVGGIEFEYFLNPVKQIEYYLKTEQSKTTAHMLTHGKILFQKGKYIEKLVEKAKEVLKKPMKKMDKLSKEHSKYYFNYLEKQLIVAYEDKDKLTFNEIAMKIFGASFNTFLKINRLYREKPLRIFKFIEKKDRKFVTLYKNALFENNPGEKYGALLKLIRFMEKKLGGRRLKEWKISDKCNYTEKEIRF
jgi:predicted nucleotidyltransferase